MRITISQLRRIIKEEVEKVTQASNTPTDYEVCDTCGYDHAYDLPNLSPEEYEAAMEAHHAAGDKF